MKMHEEPTYKDYVKPELIKKFERVCKLNSTDSYSSGIMTTAHIIMENLMSHTYDKIWKKKKPTPKQSWELGMQQNPHHSGMSASMVAVIVYEFSPRGEEFRKWCMKDDVVMVNWKER